MALLTKHGELEGVRLWDENMMQSVSVTGWTIPKGETAFVIRIDDYGLLELSEQAIQNIYEAITSESSTV